MQNVFIQIIARSKRRGVSNRKIAENLSISRNTVNKDRQSSLGDESVLE